MCKYTSMTAGHTLLPLERDDKILILTDIPARVCANCGKPYMTRATAREVEALAD
ncbi:MAG: YgiT-type zinc finger protein [Acidobacteriota bacterium]|nr:YgiT-type zinc finger protein [Acidobacteriota bacterium]